MTDKHSGESGGQESILPASPAEMTQKNVAAWLSVSQGRWPPTITPQEDAQLCWYVQFLDRLRAGADRLGEQVPILAGEFPDTEPNFIYADRKLPYAAIAFFLPDGGVRFALGLAGIHDRVRFVESADSSDLRLTVYGEYEKEPYILFTGVMGQGLIFAHEDIPRTADGLPNLRVLDLPPDRWEELRREAGPPRRRPPPLKPLAPDGYLRARSDRICKAVVESLAPDAIRELLPADWKEHGVLPGENWWRAYPFRTGKKDLVKGVIGFTREPLPQVWETLQKNGPLAVKAQYALWARAYTETGAEPGVFVTIAVPRFCDDLGFKRHKGSHRTERKREAVKVLEMMTSIEVSASYLTPTGKNRRLRGPLWQRGHIAEEYDGYADLFGSNRVGDPENWDPVAFSYAPGAFFGDADWRQFNNRVARVGAGLMELQTNTDQWAIMVGGYLGTVSRMNGYRESVLKVQTLLERTGLARAERRNPGRALDKLEKALDKVEEVGIITGWNYLESSADEPDMDDAEDLEKLIHAADKRELKRIKVIWPEDLPEIASGPKAPDRKHKKK